MLCVHAAILAQKCRDSMCVCGIHGDDKDWGGAMEAHGKVEKVERARAVCGEGKSVCATRRGHGRGECDKHARGYILAKKCRDSVCVFVALMVTTRIGAARWTGKL